MKYNDYFNEEKFLNVVKGLPDWIHTPEDLFTYCMYVKYRHHELECKINLLYDVIEDKGIKLNDSEEDEMIKITIQSEEAYNNICSSGLTLLQALEEERLIIHCKPLVHLE